MLKTEDAAERAALAATPGLTDEQRNALLNPTHSLELCRTLIRVLRAHAAALFDAKPEAEKALARKMGTVEAVNTLSVTNHNVTQVFGGAVELEVPRG